MTNKDIRLKHALEEEIPVPYFFDVIDDAAIESKELKEHIRQYGQVIFKR